MPRLPLLAALLLASTPGLNAQVRPDEPVNLEFGGDRATAEGVPEGWLLRGSAPEKYRVDLDPDVSHQGTTVAHLRLREDAILNTDDFGTLMQHFQAKHYRGKRVRLSGYVKTERAFGIIAEDGGAGLWMRVAGRNRELLAFDNMSDRWLVGTNGWTPCEVVLEVPKESEAIYFGLLLSGYGSAWVAGLAFDAVSQDVPTTDMLPLE
jgi:hypothetical protein